MQSLQYNWFGFQVDEMKVIHPCVIIQLDWIIQEFGFPGQARE